MPNVVVGESITSCPCGGPVMQCQCQCGPCNEARATVAAQPHRTCTRCSSWLPESAFSRRASGTFQSWCRVCCSAHARERREAVRTVGPAAPNRAARRSNRSAFDRPFGIEIELIHSSMSDVRDAMVTAGLRCEVQEYNHTPQACWKIVPDGSVNHGFEVVSPVLRGAAGRIEARKAFRALVDVGATVDRTCGLHVHLEATDMPATAIARLVSLWRQEQGIMDGLVAPSRRSVAYHTYCGPVTVDAVERAERFAERYGDATVNREQSRALGYERYQTLNLCSYAVHGTLEIRQHQGTLNATKALAWVQLGQAMFARALASTEPVPACLGIRHLLDALEAVGLDATVSSYLYDRHEAFAGNRIAA